MSIERRVLVEFKAKVRPWIKEGKYLGGDDILDMLDIIEREIVTADDERQKQNAVEALTNAFSNPDVLKSLLEG